MSWSFERFSLTDPKRRDISIFFNLASKYPIFIFCAYSNRKKSKLLYAIYCNPTGTFHFCAKAHCLRKICWTIHFRNEIKSSKFWKAVFLKTVFFQIPFLKSHNSVNFWAREFPKVLFDSKFLINFHTGRNSIST